MQMIVSLLHNIHLFCLASVNAVYICYICTAKFPWQFEDQCHDLPWTAHFQSFSVALAIGESNCVELGISSAPLEYFKNTFKVATTHLLWLWQGFFFFFWGPGVPPSGKNFVNPPPSDTCPHFWTKACPPSQGLSPKIWKL